MVYSFVTTITATALLSAVPLAIGLYAKKPIRLWICIVVSVTILIVFGWIPAYNNWASRMDSASLLAAIVSFCLLYFLSRPRAPKGDNGDRSKSS